MHFFQAITFQKDKAPKWLLTALLLLYVMLGIALHADFGISSDEVIERDNGIISLRYVGERFHIGGILQDPVIQNTASMPKLEVYKDRDYPVVFNVAALIIERLLKIDYEDDQKIYVFRHLLTFLVNLIGLVAVYLLAKRRFHDWRIGLLAAILLIVSPRFFAESFYNSKDIVFMSLFALATYSAISFVLKPSWGNALIHGVATALAMDIRIMAITIWAVTLVVALLRAIRKEVPWKQTILLLALYSVVSAMVMYLLWPWLWDDPLARFNEAFQKMSQFSRGPRDLLYWSQVVKTTELPWHYILTWIVISTPLLYVALFLVGAIDTLRALISRLWRLWGNDAELQDLIFLGLVVSPILAVIYLHSVLYDGWRQMYFLYPPFLMLALKGWSVLRHHTYRHQIVGRFIKPALNLLLGASLLWTALWMYRAHPLQNVYFNALAGSDVKSRFDVDYWGLGNRIAVEHILRDTADAYASIWTPSYPKLWITKHILSPLDRRRLIEVGSLKESPQYIVQTYRMDHEDYVKNHGYEIVKSFAIDGQTIFTILRLPPKPKAVIQVNQTLSFGEGGQGKHYIKMPGWSFVEPWGIWSDGKESALEFPLAPSLQNRALNICIQLMPFVAPGHPLQKVEFYVNGALIKTQAFDRSGSQFADLAVPAHINHQTDLKIQLRYFNPIAPKSVGVGIDARLLAIGIESINIH